SSARTRPSKLTATGCARGARVRTTPMAESPTRRKAPVWKKTTSLLLHDFDRLRRGPGALLAHEMGPRRRMRADGIHEVEQEGDQGRLGAGLLLLLADKDGERDAKRGEARRRTDEVETLVRIAHRHDAEGREDGDSHGRREQHVDGDLHSHRSRKRAKTRPPPKERSVRASA